MTPSQSILAEKTREHEIKDSLGRKLRIRNLTVLDTLRLFKAAGPILAQNQPWIALASLAISVTEIDGVPSPMAATESQIESIIARLGDEGITAVADKVDEWQTNSPTIEAITAGNLQGTLT